MIASNAEVRDYILQIDFLKENGRFKRDRYEMFLKNQGMSSADFEQQIRKQIVTQKLQSLFVGAATASQEELARGQKLARQKINMRFVELSKDDLASPAFVTASEAENFVAKNKSEIEQYYNDNKTEFSKPERIKARHILIRVSESRDAASAAKLAADLRKQLTPANFASIAAKNSDDPGSKAKGGDLGEFERGRMLPAFEDAAFSAKPGQITDPIKTEYGYHIIYVESKLEAKTESLASVQIDIAKKLVARKKESEVTGQLQKVVAQGNKKEVDALIAKASLKWQDTGEFDLSNPVVPKLGDSPKVVGAVIKRKSPGFIPQLIEQNGRYVVAEVTSWKESAMAPSGIENIGKTMAYRRVGDLIEGWSNETRPKFSVERNPRFAQGQ